MKELVAGHVYELDNYSGSKSDVSPLSYQKVVFMQRVNGVLTMDGTTNEEVLIMMIHRMQYLQGKLSCRENAIVITKLEEALMWLNQRTNKRVSQNVETTDQPHTS